MKDRFPLICVALMILTIIAVYILTHKARPLSDECVEALEDQKAADQCQADAKCAAKYTFYYVDAGREWVKEHCR